MAQEIVYSIDNKSRDGNLFIKVDMQKTYNRVEWKALYVILQKFGFSPQWITLIKKCIKNSLFFCFD